MPYMYWDSTYILVILGALLSMLASSKVKNTFARYSRVRTIGHITGAEAAQRILRDAGIYDVRVERIAGNLTDHYDPRTKTLRLSDSVYGASSVAAVSVAAHECGHAIQDHRNYVPLRVRAAMVPVTNIGASVSWPLIILGIILGGNLLLINIGIWLFIAVVAFHLVTLPVEFNASSRALKIMRETGILYDQENKYAKAVLNAAALTYVASTASMVLQLLRLLLLTRNYRDDN